MTITNKLQCKPSKEIMLMSISRVPVIIHFQSQNPGMHMIWDKWTLYRKCLLLEDLKRNYDDLCTPARNPVTSYNIILLYDPPYLDKDKGWCLYVLLNMTSSLLQWSLGKWWWAILTLAHLCPSLCRYVTHFCMVPTAQPSAKAV